MNFIKEVFKNSWELLRSEPVFDFIVGIIFILLVVTFSASLIISIILISIPLGILEGIISFFIVIFYLALTATLKNRWFY